MTNPRSASNAWAAIKKKIQVKGGITKANGAAEDEGSATPKATPKASPKKRAKKADTDADDGESPTKKPKATPKKSKKKVEAEDEEHFEDAAESPIKKEDDGELN